MSSFVRQPLEKLKNRHNIITAIEKLRRQQSQKRVSLRAYKLDTISPQIGNMTSGNVADMEVSNLSASGMMNSTLIQHASVGEKLLVLPSDVLDENMATADDSTLTLSGKITLAVGDVLHLQDNDDEEWMQVTDISNAPVYGVLRDLLSVYHATGAVQRVTSDGSVRVTSDGSERVVTGDQNPAWEKGKVVVSYGQAGDGGVSMVSGSDPEISLFTHAGAPQTTESKHVSLKKDSVGFGADLAAAATTGFHFSATAETYNSESMGAGDLLLGDNSTGKANLLWDASAAELQFRIGTRVMSYMSTSAVTQIGARVRRSSDQSLSLNSASDAVKVQFNTEEYDDAAFVDLGSSNTRITIPTGYAGRYEVGFYLYAIGSSVNVQFGVWLNGVASATTVVSAIGAVDASGSSLFSGITDIELAEGDYIELAGYVTTGSITVTVKGSAYRPVMWLRRIR